jgi:ZIP family zinc transporter
VQVVLALLPFVSTTLGGLAALRFRRHLGPIMAFAAGVLVATALTNLLPEAQELAGEAGGGLPLLPLASVLGFLLYAGLETPSSAFGKRDAHQSGGIAGPIVLIVHSTLDGVAIGLGYEADPRIGLLVGLAVVSHDFADGMNVVTLALTGGQSKRTALLALALDALAPVVGVLLTRWMPLDKPLLGVLLAVFGGAFLAIGAAHLLPEAWSRHLGSHRPVLLATGGAILAVSARVALG